MGNPGKLSYIDIFAGCGGMSLGLYESGWRGVFAIEKNPMAFETLRYNLIDKKDHFDWPSWLPQTEHDINNVIRKHSQKLKALQGKIDLVVGGPPCQGFSFAGRRNRNDSRNQAMYSYIKFIKLVKPRALFFENVKGFTVGFKAGRGRSEPYSNHIEGKLEDLGYNVKSKIVDFSDYGVPQRRHRFILVGIRDADSSLFFEKLEARKRGFLDGKGLPQNATVSDALSDILRSHGEVDAPESPGFRSGTYSSNMSNYQKVMRNGWKKEIPDSHRFAHHSSKTIRKFRVIMNKCEKGKAISEEIRKELGFDKKSITPLDGEQASPTLTTLPDDYIHYCEPRILTVREYARIQSFKDWYEIRGKYTTGGTLRRLEIPRYTQVGNAIAPLFGEQSGNVFNEMLK